MNMKTASTAVEGDSEQKKDNVMQNSAVGAAAAITRRPIVIHDHEQEALTDHQLCMSKARSIAANTRLHSNMEAASTN